MRRLFILSGVLFFTSMFSSCCSTKKTVNTENKPTVALPGPQAVIYQTKKDYSEFVPVNLTDDKKSVESYPDIKDVFMNGELAYPAKLNGGFFLDNRGITANSAFLNITYKEYSELSATPSPEKIMTMIQEKDPFICIYKCGLRASFQEIEKELNGKIDANDLSSFEKIK